MDWETIKRVNAHREQQEKEQHRDRFRAAILGSALLGLEEVLFNRDDLTYTEEEKKQARNLVIETCVDMWKKK